MKKKLLRLSLIFVFVLTLLFSSLALLVNTEGGSLWLVTKALKSVPELHVGQIQGRLYKTMILNDLSYHTPGATITTNKLAIDWHMLTLLRGKLSTTHIQADTLKIILDKNNNAAKQPNFLPRIPYKIHMKETEIKELSIESPALSAPIIFNNLLLNAKVYPELLSVQLITRLTSPTPMNIRLETSGKLSQYQMTLVIDQATNRWSLDAEGDLQHLHFHTNQNQLLGGTIKLLGDIDFGETQKKWLTEVDIKGIHPQLLLPDWQGTLNFKLTSRIEENLIDLALTDLNGSLKNRPVSGEFHYRKTGDHHHLIHSDLHFGDATIKAKGNINDQVELNWNINVPRLQDLFAEYSMSGSLISQGSLSGPRTLPNINAKAKGQNIHFQNWSAENLQIEANYQNSQQPIQSQISLTHVQHAEHALGNLKAQLTGTQNQHSIQLQYALNENILKLTATGHLFNSLWEGRLDNVTVESPQIHHMHLQSSTPLSLSREAFHIAPFCLINDKVFLCLNSDWKKGAAFSAEIKANKIPLELFNPWLEDMGLRGDLNAVAKLLAKPNTTPTLDLTMNLTPGIFSYTLNDVSKPFHYQGGQITAQLNEHHFKAKAALELVQNSKLTANVYTDPAHWKPENWFANPLRGDFQITAPQLDFLAALIPKISETRGSAVGHGSISGNLQHPIITGSATMTNASFTVPDINGQIKKLAATGSLHDGVLSYQGTGTAGDGTFKISGNTQIIKKQLHTHLSLVGKNMLISNTPGVKVTGTPNLQMQIVDNVMLLSGQLFIPKGEFRAYDYNDTTELPDEISYRQASPLKPADGEPVQLTSSIDIKLGDNISIDSNGLKGKLNGTFAIRDHPGGATTAQGSLALRGGKYDFRGQILTVERGVLNFNGGPVNNPNLNVRAVRYIGTFGAYKSTAINDQNRIVGIYITGTLAKHKLTLFSEPDDITQSDVLSYLVLGQSISSVSGSSGNATALLGAAQALNLTSAGGTLTKFKSQLEQKLGLSELDITSYETKSAKVLNKSTPESTIQHTAFVLGRYLTPKLYVNYSFDILDHTNVFRIRYFLNKKWSVQSESSQEGNALDILYTFERG